jgi:hypothetical protein
VSSHASQPLSEGTDNGAGAIDLVERETSASPSVIRSSSFGIEYPPNPVVPELGEPEAIRRGTAGCRWMLSVAIQHESLPSVWIRANDWGGRG